MPDEKMTKNDRREAAREAARVAREKAKKQERLRRWLIPTSVTLGVLAIATIVTIVIVNSAPPPQTEAGPRNMASDGILLVGEDGEMVPVTTPAIPASGTPTPTDPDSDVPNIVFYADFACPACQAFEAANGEMLETMVSAGEATMEIHPIAILDDRFQGSLYSTRANNVGACVADFAPESFYEVMTAMYVNQPAEGTTGLSDDQIIEVVHGAGLDDADVDKCIDGTTFASWVGAATTRATSGPLPNTELPSVTGTPTILVNGVQYTGSITDPAALAAFIANPVAA